MGRDTLLILAFDSGMFPQAQRCLETIVKHCRFSANLGIVAIDLLPEQLRFLQSLNAKIFTDYRSLRGFKNAPPYAHAMTCRPYLREIFPGYDVYVYIDADIRIADSSAFDFYLAAGDSPEGVCICREDDPTYAFVENPQTAALYHELRRQRMTQVFGADAAAITQNQLAFNAGMFAMHRDCPLWSHYRTNLEQAMQFPFDHMLEQDALMLAILQHRPRDLRVGPATMNWLCSISQPVFDQRLQRWVRPQPPHEPIAVLHLTNSNERVPVPGASATWYEWYKHVGLTR